MATPARIVVAPDKFKGSAPASVVAAALAAGFACVDEQAEIVTVPMADGGEGTVDSFVEAGADALRARVEGPLGAPVEAVFALDATTAVVEMAAASGLVLLPQERRDALRASTFGTGQLILAALEAGARRIIVGIGGSASTDGGAGMLQALGARLLDGAGNAVGRGGIGLSEIASVDFSGLDPRLAAVRIDVASDVDHPLCGPSGAAAVFGPQKGADPNEVLLLDAALARFADVVARATGRDRRDEPGAGAAGGIGFGLLAGLGATLRRGVDVIAELRGLPRALEGADLCLTGEGRIDATTLGGKTVAGVAAFAQRAGAVTFAFGGSVSPEAESALFARGIVCFPIVDGPRSLEAAMRDAPALLRAAAARSARCWQAVRRAAPRPGT